MADKRTERPLQIRKTLADTIMYQTELQNLVRRKKNNNAILSFTERERFEEIYPLAVLSHGSNPCFFRTRRGGIVRFEHLDILKYFLSEQTSNLLTIKDEHTGIVYDKDIPIRDLWTFFERQLIYVFPYAREESVHMSTEAQLKEPPTAFEFSSQK